MSRELPLGSVESEVDLLQPLFCELAHFGAQSSETTGRELLDLLQIGPFDIVARGIGCNTEHIRPFRPRRLRWI